MLQKMMFILKKQNKKLLRGVVNIQMAAKYFIQAVPVTPTIFVID